MKRLKNEQNFEYLYRIILKNCFSVFSKFLIRNIVPDLPEPWVFWPPGSGSVNFWPRSGSGSWSYVLKRYLGVKSHEAILTVVKKSYSLNNINFSV
jgi:hypothetical protein